MIFIVDYWNQDLKSYIQHSSHNSYKEAKKEMNAGWSAVHTRRLKVVDERILFKAKAGKYMVDDEDIPGKHRTAFK